MSGVEVASGLTVELSGYNTACITIVPEMPHSIMLDP